MTQDRFGDKQGRGGSLAFRILLIAFSLLILPLVLYASFVLVDLQQNLYLQETSSRILTHLLILFLLILFVGGVVTWALVRRMGRPLRQLHAVMQGVEGGHKETRFQKDPFGFEINVLGEHLNRTLDSLFEQMEEIKQVRLAREKILNELKIGHEIQKSILPKELPTLSSLNIAAGFQAATEVAGDFYDLFDAKHLMIAIGDASGKGISACLYAFLLRSMLRAFCLKSADLEEIIRRSNELFFLDTQESMNFVTLWIALYDEKKHLLHYSSCGHPFALIIRDHEPIQELLTPGIALGVAPSSEVTVHSLKLQPNDLLLLYTDGVLETHNSKGELYGKEKLYAQVQKMRKQSPQKLVDAILADIDSFRESVPQHDDITLLALHVL